jgi:hypothetical protein
MKGFLRWPVPFEETAVDDSAFIFVVFSDAFKILLN